MRLHTSTRSRRVRQVGRTVLVIAASAGILFAHYEAVTSNYYAPNSRVVDHYELTTGCIVLTCLTHRGKYGLEAQTLLNYVRGNLTTRDAVVCKIVAEEHGYPEDIVLVDSDGQPTADFSKAIGADANTIFRLANRRTIKEVCYRTLQGIQF